MYWFNIKCVQNLIKNITIFAGFTKKQQDTIMQLLEKVVYHDGDIIFEQGHEPSHIYIVQKGRVKLCIGNENTQLELIEFCRGACFGETSVIGIQPHAASAVAVGETELIVLSRNTLLSLYKTDLELFSILILNIAREACRRLYQTDQVLLHYVLDKQNL